MLYRASQGPLFAMELVLDSEGAHYTTDLTSIGPTLIEVFDRGIQSTQNVPQLEKVKQ